MKILIWFLCILANSIITAIIKANGIILGGILTFIMYMITFAVARTLCEKWQEYKNNKQKKPLQPLKLLTKKKLKLKIKLFFAENVDLN